MRKIISFSFVVTIFSVVALYGENTAKEIKFNGVSMVERTTYTVHFSDGTAKQVLGVLKHQSSRLTHSLREKIDGFFKAQIAKYQKSNNVAPDQGTRRVDAITPSITKLSVVSFMQNGVQYIQLVPMNVSHKHASTSKHKEQVETLWNPLKSVSSDLKSSIPDLLEAGKQLAKTAKVAAGLVKPLASKALSGAAHLATGIVGEGVIFALDTASRATRHVTIN